MANIKNKMGNKLANLSEHIKELNSPDEMKKRFDAVNKNNSLQIIREIKDYDILIFGFSGNFRILDKNIISSLLKIRKQKPLIIQPSP